jgi:hypothetical protein
MGNVSCNIFYLRWDQERGDLATIYDASSVLDLHNALAERQARKKTKGPSIADGGCPRIERVCIDSKYKDLYI